MTLDVYVYFPGAQYVRMEATIVLHSPFHICKHAAREDRFSLCCLRLVSDKGKRPVALRDRCGHLDQAPNHITYRDPWYVFTGFSP